MDNTMPPQANKRSKVPFAAKAILEIFFVGLLLGLIFFLLNYVNIISLKSIFPFLPSLRPNTNTTQTSSRNITKIIPSPFFTQINPSFFLNLKSTLAPNYTPPPVLASITEKNGQYTENNSLFTLIWGENGTVVFLNKAEMKIYSHTAFDLTIRISSRENTSTPLESNAAASYAQKYFSHLPSLQWTCGQNNTHSYCTTQTTVDDKKLMIYMYSTSLIPQRLFTLYCSTATQSPLYKQNNYCLFEK